MSRVPPETSNRRLNYVQFLGDNDRDLYSDLCARIDALRDDEAVTVIDPNASFAWKQMFSVYKALQRRRAADASKNAEAVAKNAGSELRWNEYIVTRAQLLEYLQREPVDQQTREYCGLNEADLQSPTIEGDERFAGARHPDWQGMADRLGTAFWKLRNLTIVQRQNIPNVIQQRRLSAAVDSIEKQLDVIVDKLQWLDDRTSVVESKFIVNKH
jgi:hypothetical protein